ncbi:hypothetical protein [Kineobactrum salinum]|uniref:Uncharacterized protein n=1 Tax=Kineobactrum salinum TaxID=2708301 RepID=A0A6C0U1T4_9GAMM|nr:hypothetical protein [Kineobactrum salinum]QIB65753.1 hypothetical protein G3T16_10330 [Kineobactrum salinum]
MDETYFKTIRAYLVSIVTVFVLGHLGWQHFNGGVVSHHLLHRADFPAISNWWGIVILPFLAWFATTRIRKRIAFQSDAASAGRKIPNGILIGFFGMLLASLLQSVAFEFGYENITMYIALAVLLIGLFLPIYRAECILGHVLGATFTFGPVIPIIGMLVIAAISALSNLCIKPLLIRLYRRGEPRIT